MPAGGWNGGSDRCCSFSVWPVRKPQDTSSPGKCLGHWSLTVTNGWWHPDCWGQRCSAHDDSGNCPLIFPGCVSPRAGWKQSGLKWLAKFVYGEKVFEEPGEAEEPCPHILEFVTHTVRLHLLYERESTERFCPSHSSGNVKPSQVHSSGPGVIRDVEQSQGFEDWKGHYIQWLSLPHCGNLAQRKEVVSYLSCTGTMGIIPISITSSYVPTLPERDLDLLIEIFHNCITQGISDYVFGE